METPDSKGFVTINWPSQNVPFGGVFHNLTVNPSSSNRDFLKVLLDESKQSCASRDKTKWQNRLRCDEETPWPRSRPLGASTGPQTVQRYYRPRTSKRRSLSTIRESGDYNIDGYVPLKRGEDREKLKERLQKSMAYGDTDEQKPPQPPLIVKPLPKLPTAKDMKHEILTQIRERAQWLAEMEELGEGAAHRDIVKDQIAERIRALDALGIDSECSSSRSTASGFSIVRSTENFKMNDSAKSVSKSARSNRTLSCHSRASTIKSETKSPGLRSGSKAKKNDEEDVKSYNKILQYSPRRRC